MSPDWAAAPGSTIEGTAVGEPRFLRNDLLICCVILAALTFVIYAQTVRFEFINYDDDHYVYENPFVRAGLKPVSVRFAFTIDAVTGNWHPLTWLSLMADSDLGRSADWLFGVSLSPPSAALYHLMNVLLHAANACLLLIALAMMTGALWRSAFVAALFVVHPLHVESVAWVAERKDVLSTLFWMLTLIAYAAWVRHPDRRGYMLVVAAFALGLLAKPMLVSIPLILLLLDVWPLRRGGAAAEPRKALPAGRLFSEKAILFGLAAASCAVTIIAQRAGGAIASITEYPFGVRAANALVAYVAYLRKLFWPTNMAVFYPNPGPTLPTWQVLGSAALLVALTYAFVRAVRKAPYLTVGWFWYLITLVPVVGLLQVGDQAMADRYTYVPYIGLFVALAWGAADLAGLLRPRRAALATLSCLSVLSIGLLAWLAHTQANYWRDSAALYTHAIRVTNKNFVAYNNLGNVLAQNGETEAAITSYRTALRYRPGYAPAHYNLGNAYCLVGDTDKAVAAYNAAIGACPDHIAAYNNLGALYLSAGKPKQAIPYLKKALKLNPRLETARTALEEAEAATRTDRQER